MKRAGLLKRTVLLTLMCGAVVRAGEGTVTPTGTIVVDPTNPTRMVYNEVYENGRLKPVFFAGPGDPEDLLWNNSQGNVDFLISRGARSTYIMAVLVDFGGGDPGSGAELDAKIEQWDGYIAQLQEAGIITVFFFFDDEARLPANWQELVDKCVERFKRHKLLIWSVAEEYAEGLSKDEVSKVAARIKEQDPYQRIVAVHQNTGKDFDFLHDPNIDMFMMQLSRLTPEQMHEAILASNAYGHRILNMSESNDHAKKDRTTVRRYNWAAAMAGCSAVQVLWMGRATDPADWNMQEKYDDCNRLMSFMESTRLNETVNRNDLKAGGTTYVLANPGQVYIAYGETGAALGLDTAAGKYRVKWFDVVTGNWVDQGTVTLAAGEQMFDRPDGIGAEAALYLEAVDQPVVIWASGDLTTRNGINYNTTPVDFGLLVKYEGDMSWIQFTLGDTPVKQAVLTLFQADGGITSPWEIVVRGAVFSFDEAVFTGTDFSDWTRVGTIPDVMTDDTYHHLDITAFYNDNVGKTITLHLYRDEQPDGHGPVFADREGTRRDATPAEGPRITIR